MTGPRWQGSDGSLDGRVALITGASRGIGAGIARAFGGAGAAIVLAARHQQDLDLIVDEARAQGISALAVPTDVTDPKSVVHLVQRTVEHFGRLDFAVNNAGGAHVPVPVSQLADEQFELMVRLNLFSTFYCLKAEIEAMCENGGGSIVNIASTAGLRGIAGLGDYVAAKHGVIGLTQSAALDCAAEGIRVNAIAPGAMYAGGLDNQLEEALERIASSIPLRRVGLPDDVGSAALWLCSDRSSYITGATIAVDGGVGAR